MQTSAREFQCCKAEFTHYLRYAEEIVHFAQSTEIELRGKNIKRDVSTPSTTSVETLERSD
uniref:Uncharacterized protein n=1 Tax=Peronospora matthiolae TaxID=2874970 RepID=A0AAV1UW78_9STRA